MTIDEIRCNLIAALRLGDEVAIANLIEKLIDARILDKGRPKYLSERLKEIVDAIEPDRSEIRWETFAEFNQKIFPNYVITGRHDEYLTFLYQRPDENPCAEDLELHAYDLGGDCFKVSKAMPHYDYVWRVELGYYEEEKE